MIVKIKLFIIVIWINLVSIAYLYPKEIKNYQIPIGIIISEINKIENTNDLFLICSNFKKYLSKNDTLFLLDDAILDEIQNESKIKNMKEKLYSMILLGKIANLNYVIQFKLYHVALAGYRIDTKIFYITPIQLKIPVTDTSWYYLNYSNLQEQFKINSNDSIEIFSEKTDYFLDINKNLSLIKNISDSCSIRITNHYRKNSNISIKKITPQDSTFEKRKLNYWKVLYYTTASISATLIAHKIYYLTRHSCSSKKENEELVPPQFP